MQGLPGMQWAHASAGETGIAKSTRLLQTHGFGACRLAEIVTFEESLRCATLRCRQQQGKYLARELSSLRNTHRWRRVLASLQEQVV